MPETGRSGKELVDDYLNSVSPPYRASLTRLRRNVRAAAPRATEGISYRMPAFFQDGALLYYGAFGDHCSLFLGSVRLLDRFSRELRPYRTGKGTLQFLPEIPIPAALIARLVKARLAENAQRVARRKSRSRPSR
ncbi:MAG TPA: DUF1801 domain-containing protein [Thermoplasmata archaeon]|nr:DUF1801 domain-containing protein [Thermoplasmata archaeon]